ncbi:MAG: energy transducer TonB [Syntrophales bacterium]
MNFEFPRKGEKYGRNKVFAGVLWSVGVHGIAVLFLLAGLIGPAPHRMVKGFDPCLKVDLVSFSHGGFAKEPDKSRPSVRKEETVKKEVPQVAREPATLSTIPNDNSEVFRIGAATELTESSLSLQDSRAGKSVLTKGFSVASMEGQSYPSAAVRTDGYGGRGKTTTPGDTFLATPRYRDNSRPAYPRLAQARGYEGTVLLSVEVLSDGRVGRTRVKSSSGYVLLDQSALDTMKQWFFEPGKKKGLPVAMWVDIPIRFALQ